MLLVVVLTFSRRRSFSAFSYFLWFLFFFFISIKEIFGSVKNIYGRICFARVQSTKYPFVFFEVVIFLFLHAAHFVSFYTFDRVTFFCCVNFIRTRVQRICWWKTILRNTEPLFFECIYLLSPPAFTKTEWRLTHVQHNISHYHSNILKFKKIKICLIKNNINPVKNRINKVTNAKTLPKN